MSTNTGAAPAAAAKRGVAAVAVLLGALLPPWAGAAGWPEIALPPKTAAVNVGTQLEVNGMPMRVKGFLSPLPPAELRKAFKSSLGEPLVESRYGGKLVLGRMQGDHYLSVELEPAGKGSRGLVTVSDVKTAYQQRERNQRRIEAFLAALPHGTRLISHTRSFDRGRTADHYVLENGQAPELNAERLLALMEEKGLRPQTGGGQGGDDRRGTLLFFSGAGREATATIEGDARHSRLTLLVLSAGQEG